MMRYIHTPFLLLSIITATYGQCPDAVESRLDWNEASWLDGSTALGYGMGTNHLKVSVDGQYFSKDTQISSMISRVVAV